MDPSSELMLELYAKMLRIRVFNDRQAEESRLGNIFGYVHLYSGMEAVAVGVISALKPGDKITSTHRAEGHFIAAGVSMQGLMAECFGRVDGICGGRAGPMGLADASIGLISAYEIVGGGIAVATGLAWGFQQQGTDQVAVGFFGDGAANQGVLYECLNMAALWRLPVIYICENNHYAVDTSIQRAFAVQDIAGRAAGFGVPGGKIDGVDVLAVHQATCQAVDRARGGQGPTFLEIEAPRWCGHHLADPQWYYRTREEVEAQKQNCPIELLKRTLIEGGHLSSQRASEIETLVDAEVEEAVRFAHASDWPSVAEIERHLFAGPGEP